jgi:CDP-diglyceride synthetase
MICDINRSIHVGFMSTLLLTLMSYLLMPIVRNLDNIKLLFLFVVMFVIATTIDYFNYCYTKCNSIESSVKYGIFTVSLIYIYFAVFIDRTFTKETFVVYGLNVLFLTFLHQLTCDYRNKIKL